MNLRDRAAITGVGETAYARGSGRSAIALSLEASSTAIADATRAGGFLALREEFDRYQQNLSAVYIVAHKDQA
jgi:hypothetical protein